MEQPAKKITAYLIEYATDQKQHTIASIIDRANKITKDPDKKDRRAKSLCVVCHYGSRLGGAAITDRPCGCCGKMQHYSSTATDILCLDCAKLLGMCKQCCALMEGKRPSRKRIEEILECVEAVKEKEETTP
jgi:hypothetical protein